MSKFGSNNIGKMIFGSNSIGKAYYGGNLVFQTGSSPTPPTPTGTIPYIRNTTISSYIDTGITPDNTTKIIVWARNWNSGGESNSWLCGSRVAYQDAMLGLALGAGTHVEQIAINYGTAEVSYVSDTWQYMSGYHKYEFSGAGLYIDDVQIATVTSETFSSNYNIFLFGLNGAGTLFDSEVPIDICACKIYKNNVLVRDFSAVNTPSVGLYDSVSGTVFQDASGGSFTYGTFQEDAYTPLEYIECSGTQYFNTGILGSNALSMVVRFNSSATSTGYIIGARTSSSSKFDLSVYGTPPTRVDFHYISATAYTLLSDSSGVANRTFVFVKDSNVLRLCEDNDYVGGKTGGTDAYTGDYPIFIGTLNLAGEPFSAFFVGKYYGVRLGSTANYVPAKVNNVAGMYDTYNDTFYPSISGTAFIAGPEL